MRNKFLYFSLCPLAAATGKENEFFHRKRVGVFPGFSGVNSRITEGSSILSVSCRAGSEA